jgi:tRNA dimethylallyltransferase
MNQEQKIPLLVIAGPTGSGKSALALMLAKRHDAEIVNLDAFQIYRGMRIGTAQPSAEELSEVRHWLYGFYDPREAMSAAQYTKLADAALAEIRSRGKRVILVGGTGFYMRALLYGLFEAPPVDEALRRSLTEKASTPEGKEEVYQELTRVDPEAAARIAKNDVYRVTRALEIFHQSGKPMSEHHKEHQRPARYEHRILAPEIERDELVRRQEGRVSEMFRAGWEAEVRGLLDLGVLVTSPGFRAIGYRSVVELILGQKTREEVLAQIRKEHQQYAKRQKTWLRSEEGVEHAIFQEPGGPKTSSIDWWASH